MGRWNQRRIFPALDLLLSHKLFHSMGGQCKMAPKDTMPALKTITSLLVPKLRSIMHFMAAQGITLAGNLLYGLLCVRLLPTSDYAQFVVLFAVQGTLVVLMDVNFSGSLVPLIGERVHDRKLIADYVASLRSLAHRIYLVMGAGLILFYPILVKNRHWSWQVVSAMVATLLVSTWFMRIGAAYGAVLILLRDRKIWYQGQMISSLGTLALLGVFWSLHVLVAFSAILINVAGIVFVGVFYFFRARRVLGLVGVASPAKCKAIVQLALPNVAPSIYYALQGQISLLLITIFGHTAGVASVGALGRLGQIFALFAQINPILVEPYFAKLPKPRLKSSYLLALAIAGGICIAAGALASSVPELFLWILGPKYRGLRYEVLLVIAASAISYCSGVLWCIHLARRFVYWWSNIATMVLVLLIQIVFIVKADLSDVRSVLWLTIATNAAYLILNILSGVYGFIKGPREVDLHAGAVLSERSLAEN